MKTRGMVTDGTSSLEFGHSARSVIDLISASRLRCQQRGDILLVDLFPELATVRNVWENELAFVEGERAGAVVSTER
jgi:hypothetical protein